MRMRTAVVDGGDVPLDILHCSIRQLLATCQRQPVQVHSTQSQRVISWASTGTWARSDSSSGISITSSFSLPDEPSDCSAASSSSCTVVHLSEPPQDFRGTLNTNPSGSVAYRSTARLYQLMSIARAFVSLKWLQNNNNNNNKTSITLVKTQSFPRYTYGSEESSECGKWSIQRSSPDRVATNVVFTLNMLNPRRLGCGRVQQQ
uniref:Uncharacterized protein n=1 Tax=Anopheles quadriannulatus TaxID=34691 RepID=A0A182XCH9_ANOQN